MSFSQNWDYNGDKRIPEHNQQLFTFKDPSSLALSDFIFAMASCTCKQVNQAVLSASLLSSNDDKRGKRSDNTKQTLKAGTVAVGGLLWNNN